MGANLYVHHFKANGGWQFPQPTSHDLMDILTKIPLEARPCSAFDDEIVWTLEETGCFTLKSAYHLPKNLTSQNLH